MLAFFFCVGTTISVSLGLFFQSYGTPGLFDTANFLKHVTSEIAEHPHLLVETDSEVHRKSGTNGSKFHLTCFNFPCAPKNWCCKNDAQLGKQVQLYKSDTVFSCIFQCP